jgi:hypothetical protein
MSSLTGHKIKDTYQSLLKTNDNGLITTAFKQITDGSGSASGLYLKNNGVEISGSLIVNGIDIINGNIVEIPFLNNQTDDINIIKNYQNIINHGDLLVKLNDTLIIEENAQYLILGQLINNGTVVVSGSLIANQGITGPGSIIGPGTILNNTTIITYDKANQPYGFSQLNNTGYSYFGFISGSDNLLSNYSTVATSLDGQQTVYLIDTTGWDANTEYLHYYLPEGQYEGQSVELIITGNGVNLGGGNAAKIQIWIDSIRRPEYYGQLSAGAGGWQAFSDPNVYGNWRKDIPRAIWINNAWTIDNDFYYD